MVTRHISCGASEGTEHDCAGGPHAGTSRRSGTRTGRRICESGPAPGLRRPLRPGRSVRLKRWWERLTVPWKSQSFRAPWVKAGLPLDVWPRVKSRGRVGFLQQLTRWELWRELPAPSRSGVLLIPNIPAGRGVRALFGLTFWPTSGLPGDVVVGSQRALVRKPDADKPHHQVAASVRREGDPRSRGAQTQPRFRRGKDWRATPGSSDHI